MEPAAFVAPHRNSGYLSAPDEHREPLAREPVQRPHGRWHDFARAPTGKHFPRRVGCRTRFMCIDENPASAPGFLFLIRAVFIHKFSQRDGT
jgi:hypothetical protein